MRSVVKRIYVLDGGSLNLEASGLLAGRDCGRRIDVPVPMYLLETEVGHVVVDLGNDPRVIDDPEGTWGAQLAAAVRPNMRPENDPREQIALLGLSPEDVKLVVYTHLHHDHCGGARLFPHARHVVQRSEYRWAQTPDHYTQHIYLQSDFGHPEIEWFLVDGDTVLLPGIHLMHTPGHSPGHQSVALWGVPDLGTVFLAGDAIYMRDSVRLDNPPSIVTNVAEAMASMHRLTALAEVHDAMLLTGHDPEMWALIAHCPEPLTRLPDEERRFWRDGVELLYGRDGADGVIDLAGAGASAAVAGGIKA